MVAAAVAVTEGLATTANESEDGNTCGNDRRYGRAKMCAISGEGTRPDGEREAQFTSKNARCRTNLRQLTVLIGLNGHCASGLRRSTTCWRTLRFIVRLW